MTTEKTMTWAEYKKILDYVEASISAKQMTIEVGREKIRSAANIVMITPKSERGERFFDDGDSFAGRG